jgi:D-alanyl-D-alanine-carboxypeptidase/D-alanyl-D-alanine-endopeptidase
MKRLVSALIFSAVVSAPSCFADVQSDLDAIILPQIQHGDLKTVIVGISDNGKHTFYKYGAVDERSIFEIGSVTKTFTGITLGELSARGALGLNDPLARYFPVLAGKDAGKITLLELSTHTSGLPRLADNWMTVTPFDIGNPYASYNLADLLTYLSSAQLPPPPSEFDEKNYSNVGVGTLGAALTIADHVTDYSALVTREVTAPLGLQDTVVNLTDEQKARFVPGYTEAFTPAEPWDFNILAGAGGLRSTVSDLLSYADANINPPDSDLGRGMVLSHALQKEGTGQWAIGLNWMIQQNATNGDPQIWHNGGTGGYSSFVAFQAKAKRAVVYLSDSGFPPQCLDAYLMHVPCQVSFGFALSAQALSKVIGDYQSAVQGVDLEIERIANGYLIAKSEGEEFRVTADSATSFEILSLGAKFDLELDPSGQIIGMTFTQEGQQVELTRLNPAHSP